jgi:hypothetical protein
MRQDYKRHNDPTRISNGAREEVQRKKTKGLIQWSW